MKTKYLHKKLSLVFLVVVICSFVVLQRMYSQEQKKTTILVEKKNSPGTFAGMGIYIVAASDIADYVNSQTFYENRADVFSTAVDFFGGVEFPIDDEIGLKLEHSYLFKSFLVPFKIGGNYNFFYEVHAPSLILQRVFSGQGYFLKIGAGGGMRFGHANEQISLMGTASDYQSTGFGFRGEIVAQTAFDEDFYGYINGVLGWEFVGTLKDIDNQSINSNMMQNSVTLNYFFIGLRFGIMYYF